ncbi:hypothetical protein QU481_12855 [Crenobacter sp. SG2303]|uniref:Alpha/beta hydrolase n=1 Tax=Crenobacter oryzisoli TaxID=3056844 RepID=A0ABT7XPT3_9NEIS|nr:MULTISPECIES: hypothetical protein [unclassified Crenobacter]MDN0075775.1 hypothetical protein [Crenobacter sp. SG2303]MDN0082706.1 hypothetical protein [Crenobacter sp. SG2305]
MSEIKVKFLTDSQNNEEKIIPIKNQLIIFLIGGAADKRPFMGAGPTNLITEIQSQITKKYQEEVSNRAIRIIYLGYYEIFGERSIWNVLNDANLYFEINGEIFLKQNEIIIIGHSLGGWNGAHFTASIKKWRSVQKIKCISPCGPSGLNVSLLITLDPVGQGVVIGTFADIYFSEPKVNITNWINIYYDAESYSGNDFIADLGGQWRMKSGPRINATANLDHAETLAAMTYKLNANGDTALNETYKVINKFLNE